MTDQKNEEPQEDLSSITGDAHGSAAANIGRDGDALVQDDVVCGTETERQGTREDREREMKSERFPESPPATAALRTPTCFRPW